MTSENSLPGQVSYSQRANVPERLPWIRLGPAASIVVLSGVLLAIIFGIFAFLCVQGYDSSLKQAEQRAQASAQVMAEHGEWIIGSSLGFLDSLDFQLNGRADTIDALELDRLDGALKRLPGGAVLGVYGATGAPALSRGEGEVPDNVADSPWFAALANGAEWQVFPVPAGADGRSRFVIARALRGGGTFTGAAAVFLQSDLMASLWKPLQLGDYSTVSIVRDDGWVIARFPALQQPLSLGGTDNFRRTEGQDSGFYHSDRSPADGIARVVAFQRSSQFGVLGFASVAEDTILASFWRAVRIVLLLMGPIAIALILVAMLAARLLRRSRHTQTNLENALAHNEMLFSEIHHRVKNNLQAVASLLQMQPISAEVKAEMSKRIVAMSAVHEHIYRTQNFANVQVKDYLETLIANVRAGYDDRIRLITDIEDVTVDKDDATPLGLIVNEVVSNAFKHAFPDGRKGTITITLRQEGSQGVLTVADDGIGFAPDKPSKGIGRKLMRALSGQLKGDMEMCSEAGSRFTLTFPLAA